MKITWWRSYLYQTACSSCRW